MLQEVFGKFGSIMRITIRCSRGQAVGVGMPIPVAALTSRDRQYATIEFNDPNSVKKALKMNGAIVDGCRLVVRDSSSCLKTLILISN